MASPSNRSAEVKVSKGFGSQGRADKKTNYWKKNSERVPGSITPVYSAQYPPSEIPSHARVVASTKSPAKSKSKKGDSFSKYENSTKDIWDIDDDEDFSPQRFPSGSNQSFQPQSAATSGRVPPPLADGPEVSSTSSSQSSSRVATSTSAAKESSSSSHPSGIQAPRPASPIHKTSSQPVKGESRVEKFREILNDTNTNLDELRKHSWNGIPDAVRPITWKLLLGYLPTKCATREETLQRKRAEYFGCVEQYYESRHDQLHIETFRQIHIDIPRTNPLIPMFQDPAVQEIFERILFIWAIRHPASGYVQGINDLVTPFFFVFLSELVGASVDQLDNFQISKLPEESIKQIEADSYWCTSKLLDGIQDNYTFAQPGIQVKINQLKELIMRINAPLHKHLDSNQVEYLQFAFRWMNNLLMRELPLGGTIRLWDTYMSEKEGFSVFHLYVCAALLQKYADQILSKWDFQGIMLYLQNLPTKTWKNDDISLLLAEAYSLKYMFADAPKHLGGKKKR